MSLNSILNIAQTGLNAAQTGLTVVSNNVTNVNTTGYVRQVVDQTSAMSDGMGIGVSVEDIRTAADAFLEQTSRAAISDQGAADVTSSILGQAQSLLGNPSTASTSTTNTVATTTFASSFNALYASFISLTTTPGAAAQSQAVNKVQGFVDQADQVSAGLDALSTQVDSQVGGDVTQINSLLTQISSLNAQISRATVSGTNASGAQDIQSEALDSLASLINVGVDKQPNGTVTLRSSTGALLVYGPQASTVAFDRSASVATAALNVVSSTGVSQSLGDPGGETSGLLALRNTKLPGIKSQLAELVGQTANQLNAVHNAYSAVPPPQSLTGRDTGVDQTTALSGFTGKTTVAITDAAGNSQSAVTIDFQGGTLTASSGSVTAFTPATFDTDLTAALGGAGTASFSHGALRITAASSLNGVVVSDDATTPSSKAGRSFSSFLGLNDLVTSTNIANYDTGLTSTSASGFVAGGKITFDLSGTGGAPAATVSVTTAGGGTIGDLVTQLNAATGGVGLYGAFALDANGALTFTPNATAAASGVKLSVAADTTSWGTGGASFSALFGVGDAARSERLGAYQVRSDIASDPTKLALASYSTTRTPPLSAADTAGADALAQSANATTTFAAAGVSAKTTTSVTTYAASVAASIGNQAANAASQATAAEAINTEAKSRRSSTEGVNLDQELVSLTTYQQAYSASARLVQASKDMFTSLIGILN